MPTSLLSRFDKCFAAAWLDHDRVLLGTKDNKLASLNIDTGECNEVPLPSRLRFERTELTEASERADGDWISEPSTSRNASPSYAIGQDPGFAPFGRGRFATWLFHRLPIWSTARQSMKIAASTPLPLTRAAREWLPVVRTRAMPRCSPSLIFVQPRCSQVTLTGCLVWIGSPTTWLHQVRGTRQ